LAEYLFASENAAALGKSHFAVQKSYPLEGLAEWELAAKITMIQDNGGCRCEKCDDKYFLRNNKCYPFR